MNLNYEDAFDMFLDSYGEVYWMGQLKNLLMDISTCYTEKNFITSAREENRLLIELDPNYANRDQVLRIIRMVEPMIFTIPYERSAYKSPAIITDYIALKVRMYSKNLVGIPFDANIGKYCQMTRYGQTMEFTFDSEYMSSINSLDYYRPLPLSDEIRQKFETAYLTYQLDGDHTSSRDPTRNTLRL